MSDWRDQGYCTGRNPELWFPDPSDHRGIASAKKLCVDNCPVRQDCLTWALDAVADYGVMGGLSEDERRTLRKRPPHRRVGKARHAAERADLLEKFLDRIGGRAFTSAEYADTHGLALQPSATQLGFAVVAGRLRKLGTVKTGEILPSGEQRKVRMYQAVAS